MVVRERLANLALLVAQTLAGHGLDPRMTCPDADEPAPGEYVHRAGPRITEWPVAFLSRPRRTSRTIPDFLAPDAPPNRLDVLRGAASPAGQVRAPVD